MLAIYYSLVIPPWEAVDEIDHYHYAQFLLTERRLPEQATQGQPQEVLLAHHPPLYYLMLALVIAPVDQSNPKASARANTDFRWGDPNHGGYNRVFHGDPSETFPYDGPIRGLHVGRLLSVLAGGLVLFATWQMGRVLAPGSAGATALAMAAVGFLPGFLVSAATVHHDSWVAAFAALGLWRLFLYLRVPTAGNVALAAVLFALAALTKASGLVLLALLPLAVFLVWWRSSKPSPLTGEGGGEGASPGGTDRPARPLRPRGGGLGRGGALPGLEAGSAPVPLAVPTALSQLAAAAAAYLAIMGWWLARNQALYGDPLGWGVFSASPLWPIDQRPITAASFLGELVAQWTPGSDFWRSLLFGAGQMVFGQALLLGAAFALTATGLGGLLTWAWTHWDDRRAWAADAVIAATAVLLVVGGIVRYSLTFFGPNGRYLFPALPLIALGLVCGWRALLPRAARVPAAAAASLGLLGLAVFTPPGLFLPTYTLANRLDPAEAAALGANQRVTFGGQIELVRADLTPERPALGDPIRARLVWRAIQDVPRSYRAFVHVVGLDGAMAGGVDRVPGNGAASTGLWRRGDVVYDDFEVTLRPNTRPGLYRVVSSFYRFPDLVRLPAAGDRVISGDVTVLRELKLLPPVAWAGQPIAQFGTEIALARAEIAPTLARFDEPIEVRLLWLASRQPSSDYTVSIQLLGPDRSLVAQHDSPPLDGALPTSSWDAGDLVPDTVVVRVPPGAPSTLTVTAVVYRSSDGERLPVGSGDSQVLGRLTMEPPTAR